MTTAYTRIEESMALHTNDEGGISLSKSTLVSRNITVLGRRTSIRLEPEMWNALREIARREKCKIHDLCSLVHLRKNPDTSLTAAIRVFLMLYFRAAATEDGHTRAGHGNINYMMQRARMNGQSVASLRGRAPFPQGGAGDIPTSSSFQIMREPAYDSLGR